jgi:dTDP-4-amino-4,6-dideoxygalactose transaminase
MSNILAGIGLGQMEVLDKRVSQKREIFNWYKTIFAKTEGITFQEEPSSEFFSNRWLTSIIIDEKITGFHREDLRLLLEKHNIESRPLWKPMHLQPVFKDAPAYINGTSELLFDKGLCLPSGTNMDENDKLRIEQIINKLLK